MMSKGDLELYAGHVDAVVIAGLSAGEEIKDLYNWILDNGLENKVYMIGAGYENDYVAHFILQEPEKTIFKHAKVITGRTKKVPSLIHELKLPYHHINCPALLSVESVKNIEPDKKIEKIGFSIQIPHEIGIVNQATGKSMYALAVELLIELSAKYEVTVVAHHKSEYFHFLNLTEKKSISADVFFSSFYQDLHNVYPKFDLFVTTRLHSGLFANGFGIPAIIINETDRHTHCLEGFPHSVWINSKEKFQKAFSDVKNKSLADISSEMRIFKQKLIGKYLEVLYKPFGVNVNLLQSSNNSEKTATGNVQLPIHFFTIVLNGKPFIDYHINVMKKLPFKWHWHIVEGVADLKHDTSWSLENGGKIVDSIHNKGLSKDGTAESLDELIRLYPDNVTVYRKENNSFWDGKIEMVSKPLENIKEECLLWQVDVDELWTAKQMIEARNMFIKDPSRTAAYFYCFYFVGEKRIIVTDNTYGNHTDYEWLRLWKYRPGDKWLSHEPPRLSRMVAEDVWIDLGKVNVFAHSDTKSRNLVFQHYAYVTEEQLKFKEIYYGYKDPVAKWKELNLASPLPVALNNYFEWVTDGAMVEDIGSLNINPLANKSEGDWQFADNVEVNCSKQKTFYSADDYSMQAEDEIRKEDLNRARHLLLAALNMDRNNIDAMNNLAVVEIMEEKFTEADSILNKILSLDPGNDVANDNRRILDDLLNQNNSLTANEDEAGIPENNIRLRDIKDLKFQLNFDLNDGCNLNCVMCGNVPNKTYKYQNVMPWDIFHKNLAPAFRHATVFQFGCFFEPLMVPYFEKAILAIKENLPEGIRGTIITNGMLLNDSKIAAMVDSGIFNKIRFSIDSISEELFEKIRVGAKLKVVLKNIEKLVEYINQTKSKTLVEVNFTIMPENILELPELILLAKKIGIHSITTHKLTPQDVSFVNEEYYNILTENIALAEKMARENNVLFSGQVYRMKNDYEDTINRIIRKDCGYDKKNYLLLTIDCHGNVNHQCKINEGALGCLIYNGFEEIISMEKFSGLYHALKNPDSRLCIDCGMFI
jgi:MoaA/NifB/PqqE/SkfB family radical SAM enzyme